MMMTIPEYARREGVSRQAVWARIKRGTLKAEQYGRQWMVDVDEETAQKAQEDR